MVLCPCVRDLGSKMSIRACIVFIFILHLSRITAPKKPPERDFNLKGGIPCGTFCRKDIEAHHPLVGWICGSEGGTTGDVEEVSFCVERWELSVNASALDKGQTVLELQVKGSDNKKGRQQEQVNRHLGGQPHPIAR
jgi:hypothetical protein